MLLDILEALVFLGFPVFLLSWYLFRRLYLRGDLQSNADYGTIKTNLKTLRKQKLTNTDFFHKNWMKFGGGYYGITAVATLLLIEASDLFQFIFNFPGLEALLVDGVVSLIVDVILNQIQNIITAALWFFHWMEDDRHTLIWVGVSYGSYYLGLRLAAHSIEHWIDVVRNRFHG